jgi:hypothetical protein
MPFKPVVAIEPVRLDRRQAASAFRSSAPTMIKFGLHVSN